MRIVSFGEAAESGPELLAAAVAALAFGLFPYGAFLLLARGFYALGASRTPGLVSVAVAAVGVVLIAVVAPLTDGADRVAVLGAGHSVAYLIGAAVILVGLRSDERRVGKECIGSSISRV